MTHGQLFAGIGGFGLAAQWAGIENMWANEIDPYCCKLLRQNFPNTKIYEQDIREIGGHNLRSVEIISGGFPCQPFSAAGLKKGTADDRYLWPEMLRIIGEVKPQWVIGENVAGLLSMENGKILERILSDLEDKEYRTETFLIPASAAGAWHRRDRLWIVAHSRHPKPQGRREPKTDNYRSNGAGIQQGQKPASSCVNVSDTGKQRLQEPARGRIGGVREQKESFQGSKPGGAASKGWEYWATEPEICRVAHGIPRRVDRIKGLGNAIVPQVAYEIFKAILEHDS